MKIVLSGGGTLGPVTPLLSIYEVIRHSYPQADFVWIGTTRGPERRVVESAGIPFFTLSSGKFRRYLSIWNVVDIARIVIGFFQSLVFLWKENPNLCISAGGFISVPVHTAAWFLGIPTWIHQQDLDVGLANRFMAPFAKQITTALESQIAFFPKKKTQWLGNPVRKIILSGDKKAMRLRYHIEDSAPIVFVTGGGTGSMKVNTLVTHAVQHLIGFAHVIHLSGLERPQELVDQAQKHFSYYHTAQFFDATEMADAYACADIVVSRGGFGTIAELASLGKCAVLIPKPGHQEENVRFLSQADGVVLVDEQLSDGNYLAKILRELLSDPARRAELGKQLQKLLPRAGEEKILSIVKPYLR